MDINISLQTVAAVGGMILALVALNGAWTYWLVRDSERNLGYRIDRNHRELLALLEGHTHGDGAPPVFHRLTGPGD